MKYLYKMVDPFNNIEYGSTEKEEFVMFDFEEGKHYPIQVEMIGVTNPDKNYFISRKVSDYFVIEYIESGKGYIEENGVKYDLEADDVYILKPGSSHKYGADKVEPYRKIWINCFSTILGDFLKIYNLENKVVFKNSGCRKHFEDLLFLAENRPYNDENSVEISKIIFSLLLDLCEKSKEASNTSLIVEQTKHILDSSIFKRITVEEIAKEINVSKSQITREFKKYYNDTPYKYLLNKKITLAKHLLLNTNKKILEISDALCFSDEYNFSNMFKKKVGVTPKVFRRKEGKINEN